MQALKKDFPGRLIKNYKFTFMYCYLLEFGQKFQRAAFMDVRDVYFQRDPFQAAACRGLTASTETAALSVYDRRLIHSDHYPLHCDTRWAEFQGVPPINSGVFIADVDTMMGLVHQTDAILEKCGAGYDQGTFTELVYLRQIRAPVTLHTTEHGPIAMICNSLSVQIDAYGTVVNERGDAYAVVHQFDRFDELNALVARTMPYDASKFREACKSPAPRP
ncbi:hypothetical protein M885DRAFT_525480 [Pelagophyceae sp. CCMP2097]|nr:hypothetical protein M885DRAFT_525480 [Pelagophyceae sp. CCMP2097]